MNRPPSAPRASRRPAGLRAIRRVARLALPVALMSVPSCGHESVADRAVARDSAGIRIVENAAAMWTPETAWTVADTPLVRLDAGGADSTPVLWQVTGMLRLSDGTVVVANGGTNELQYYDADGSWRRSAGREGEGPGEFRRLGRIWSLPGDTVIAYDPRLDRLSVFDASGALVGTARAPTHVRYQYAFPDGTMLGRSARGFSTGELTRVDRDSVLLTLHARDGTPLDTLGWHMGDEEYVFVTSNAVGTLDPPFSTRSALAATDGLVYTGYGDRYEIRVWSVAGELQRIVRRPVAPAPIGAGLEEYVARFDEPDIPSWLRREIDKFTWPATVTVFLAFRADADGNLWVRRPAWPRSGPDAWDVFDPAGLFLGTLRLPDRFEPWQIGGDWILGTWTDDLDVEHAGVYALTKPIR